MDPKQGGKSPFRSFRAWRLVQAFRPFKARPGDIISIKAPNADGVYWLAAVGRSSREGTAVRVLASRDERPRKFSREELDPRPDPVIISPTELVAGEPRIVEVGPTEFWNEEKYVLADK